MEIFFFFIVIVIVLAIIESNSKSKQGSQHEASIPKNQRELLYLKITKDNSKNDGLSFYNIETQGLLPNRYKMNLQGALYLYDDRSSLPFLSNFSQTDESESSRVFRRNINLGVRDTGLLFPNWVLISNYALEGIQHPYSGDRKVRFEVIYFDAKAPVIFKNGHIAQGKENILHLSETSKILSFEEAGYMDAIDNEEKCKPLMVAISMSMALCDGSLDKTEGVVIKSWIKKEIDYVDDEKKDDLKKQLNDSLESSYKEILATGNANSSIKAFNKIATKDIKYQLIQLCLDVLSADGVADEKELKHLEKLTDQLGLSFETVKKMKDKMLVKINTNPISKSHSASDESIVGLSNGLSDEEALKFIKTEYRKWNGRLNTVSAGTERENAQLILDALGRLRKKYEQK